MQNYRDLIKGHGYTTVTINVEAMDKVKLPPDVDAQIRKDREFADLILNGDLINFHKGTGEQRGYKMTSDEMSLEDAEKVLFELWNLYNNCSSLKGKYEDRYYVANGIKVVRHEMGYRFAEKPIKFTVPDDFTDADHYQGTNYACPRCRADLRAGYHQKYCNSCGQKINWSDEE